MGGPLVDKTQQNPKEDLGDVKSSKSKRGASGEKTFETQGRKDPWVIKLKEDPGMTKNLSNPKGDPWVTKTCETLNDVKSSKPKGGLLGDKNLRNQGRTLDDVKSSKPKGEPSDDQRPGNPRGDPW